MSKILVIGSLNMDLVIETPVIPVFGETVLGSGFMTSPGGKGANQAVAIGRLGGNVSMAGFVGGDSFGSELIENLKRNNVNAENVHVCKDKPTGVAVIVVKEGNNFIIVDSGANYSYNAHMILGIEQRIKEFGLLVLQHELPIETVVEAVRTAKKHGIKVLLNPAPAITLPDDIYKQIDIFTPNEFECATITGLPVNGIEDAKTAAGYLLRMGINQVAVTLGSRGVVYNKGAEIIHKSVPAVKAIDTTAAGDAFTGALAVAISEGMDADAAIDFANMAGALTVTKRGAQISLPFRNEVDAMINIRKLT